MVLASGQAYPAATAVDATSIYWTAEGDGTVMKLPLAGGTPTVLASVPGSPGAGKGIAVDATSVYWTDWTSGKVMKVTPK
jgi:hypothetical protein